jgi:SRSO17 transposase
MGDAKNKSVETMMLHEHGDNREEIRAMQHFISEGVWDDRAVLKRHAEEVSKDLGEAGGVLVIDGSDFAKQGSDSAGVQRQWCGELGKVENCQAGVFLGYASSKGYTLLGRRLYLPESWFSTDYQEKREKCKIPEDVVFKSKTELALEMVVEQAQLGVLPYQWLCFDEFFGRDSVFLKKVAHYGVYLAEVPCDTHVYLSSPRLGVAEHRGRGRKPSRMRVLGGKAQTVAETAAALPPECWQRLILKEGSKGPIVAELACLNVFTVQQAEKGNRLEVREQRLVLRRDPLSGECKYYLSNAPKDTPIETFARISVMRWPIESCFEEGKQELGMGDYQLRSYLGWHHHMTLVILAHFFLVRLKLSLKDKAPNLTLPQAVMLLKASLPQASFDLDKTVRIVNYYQERHEAARQSHRKKRLAQLGEWLE